MRPLIQSLLAFYLATFATSLATTAALLVAAMVKIRGFGAFAIGFSPVNLLWGAALGLVVAGLHALTGCSRRVSPHRCVALGIIGGLLAALPVAWVMSVVAQAGEAGPWP